MRRSKRLGDEMQIERLLVYRSCDENSTEAHTINVNQCLQSLVRILSHTHTHILANRRQDNRLYNPDDV
jgi:hypothetical protein